MAYNSAYTGSQIDQAVGAVREKESTWDSKQDELVGTEDQIVGFNSAGEAVAVPPPDTGVTTFNGRTGAVTPQSGDYTADMVGARPNTWTPTAADVGAVPTSRTINSKPLSSDVTLNASDVGALTQSQADARYLQLSGGTMPDNSTGIKFPMNLNNPFAYSGDGENYFSGIYFTAIGDVPGIAFITRYGERPSSPGGNHILQLDDPTYGSGIMAGASYTVDKIKNPLNLATKAYVDSKRPKYASVTLTAAGWSTNQQTVTVNGVLADESAQLIQPMPAVASQQAYMAAGIYCSGQAANSLTFTCSTVPTQDITVYVTVQEVQS